MEPVTPIPQSKGVEPSSDQPAVKPDVLITVHVCQSPSRYPSAQFTFTSGKEARDFCDAVSRSPSVYRVYATNKAGARLCGFDYVGRASKG